MKKIRLNNIGEGKYFITYLKFISPGSTLSALASLRMVTNLGLRSPRSSLQIALIVTPDSRERSAWLMTFLILSSFKVDMQLFHHKRIALSNLAQPIDNVTIIS